MVDDWFQFTRKDEEPEEGAAFELSQLQISSVDLVTAGATRRTFLLVKREAKGADEWARLVPFAKVDEEKRLVYMIVMEPGDAEHVDAQDDFTKAEEIEAACHDFMARYPTGKAGLGLQHERGLDGHIKECYIAPQAFTMGGQNVLKGSWLMVAYIAEDEVWQEVKSGELTAASIEGRGQRTQVKADRRKAAATDTPRGGNEMSDIEKQIEFRRLMKSADATLILGDMIEKKAAAGELTPGDGQTAGLISKAMDAGWDFEKFMELPAGVREAHRWDNLKGKNTHLTEQYAEAHAVAKQRAATDAGPQAELLRQAKELLSKSGGKLDVADAILQIRRENPELRAAADNEARQGYAI